LPKTPFVQSCLEQLVSRALSPVLVTEVTMFRKTSLKAFVVLALLIGLFIPLLPARAGQTKPLPSLADFKTAVTNGQANALRGVYVQDVLAKRIVQQPQDNPGFVSQMDGVVTQFSLAAMYNVVGLLAHNNLAGASFPDLAIGQRVQLIYGDGRVSEYEIDKISRFQALQPNSGNSNFVDLDTHIVYTASQIFAMFYEGGDHVTFQTCIFKDGNLSWGRLFVTAVPAPLINSSDTHTPRSH
jgi:hypothetical protein